MKALQFRLSLPRLALGKGLEALRPGGALGPLGPVALVELPEPTLPADDWLLVRTRFAGICGSDLKQVALAGASDNPLTAFISFPHVMGHELSGVVERCGPAVRGPKPGDAVVCQPWLSCAPRGLPPCPACRRGALQHCQRFAEGPLGQGMHLGTCAAAGGAFAPLVAVHASMCFTVPDGVGLDEAALADPFSVSLHAVGKAPPAPGQTVLVIGCGVLGLSAIHLLHRLYRDVRIWALDVHPHLEAVARAHGADAFFRDAPAGIVERVAEQLGAPVFRPALGARRCGWLLDGVDAVYDTVGAPSTVELGLRVVRPEGSIVLVGVSTPARFEWTPLYFKEVRLVGSNGCGLETFEGLQQHGFAHYLDLRAAGRVDLGALITHRFSLANYRRAFAVARDKHRHHSLKVMFEMRGG